MWEWPCIEVGWEPIKGGSLCFKTSCKSWSRPQTLDFKSLNLLEDHRQESEGLRWPLEIYWNLQSFCEWQIGIKTPSLDDLSINEQRHMGYISFQLHMKLTIKYKKVLGGDRLTEALWSMETVLRLKTCQVRSAGNPQKTKPVFPLVLSPSLQVSLPLSFSVTAFVCRFSYFSFPSILGFRLPSGCSRTSWKHIAQLSESNS